MEQEKIERSFTVTAPAHLRVNNIRGSVDVQPGDDGVVTITAVKYLDSGDRERTEIEIVQEGDGTVKAKTYFRKTWEWLFDWRSPCKVDYTVRVPRSCAVRVRCVSGDATVQGLQGEIDLKTISGTLQVRELTGTIRLRSVSGDVSGKRLAGPLQLETISGRARLVESNLPSVDASSVSGDLSLETALGSGPYRFKTVSGAVKLTIPAGGGCTVETSTVSGRLRTSLPVTKSWGQDRNRGSELQGGGPGIAFSSVSGDLHVVHAAGEGAPVAQPAPAPAAQPAPAPAASAARRQILERIARGELTAEQGVIELKKLRI